MITSISTFIRPNGSIPAAGHLDGYETYYGLREVEERAR